MDRRQAPLRRGAAAARLEPRDQVGHRALALGEGRLAGHSRADIVQRGEAELGSSRQFALQPGARPGTLSCGGDSCGSGGGLGGCRWRGYIPHLCSAPCLAAHWAPATAAQLAWPGPRAAAGRRATGHLVRAVLASAGILTFTLPGRGLVTSVSTGASSRGPGPGPRTSCSPDPGLLHVGLVRGAGAGDGAGVDLVDVRQIRFVHQDVQLVVVDGEGLDVAVGHHVGGGGGAEAVEVRGLGVGVGRQPRPRLRDAAPGAGQPRAGARVASLEWIMVKIISKYQSELRFEMTSH